VRLTDAGSNWNREFVQKRNLGDHGDDGREVVVLGVVALAIGGSYSKISNN